MSIKDTFLLGIKITNKEHILFFIALIMYLINKVFDVIFGRGELALWCSVVLSILIWSFIAGGFITLIKEILEDKKYNSSNFFINCKKYFLRIFTIQFISILWIGIFPFLIIVLKKYPKFFITIIQDYNIIFYLTIFLISIFFIFILLLSLILITWIDISIVIEDSKVIKSLKNFFDFFKRNKKIVILIVFFSFVIAFVPELDLDTLLDKTIGKTIISVVLSTVLSVILFILIAYFKVVLSVMATAFYIQYCKERKSEVLRT